MNILTTLEKAAKLGNIEVIKEHLSSIHTFNFNYKLIKAASRYGHLECVKWLYQYSSNNQKDIKLTIKDSIIISCITHILGESKTLPQLNISLQELENNKMECLKWLLSTPNVEITNKVIFIAIQNDHHIALEIILSSISQFEVASWMINMSLKLNSYKCFSLLNNNWLKEKITSIKKYKRKHNIYWYNASAIDDKQINTLYILPIISDECN